MKRSSFALAVALLLALTACSSADDPAPGSSAAGGAWPVKMSHKYGETTIPAEPKRIVTVGLMEQDALIALGVVPIATTNWLGEYPGAIGPWAQDELKTLGGTNPEVLKDTGGGPEFEKIAALKPDLILALYSGVTKEQYDTLSGIAPTVAQPKEYADYGIPWQEITTNVGQAIGKADRATSLVRDVEAKFEAARQANPAFAGKSALVATPYEGTFVYGSQDNRTRILTALGFGLPADLDKVIGDAFGANISAERTDLLDRDALVWIVTDPAADKTKLHADRVYGGLRVAKEGREVFIDEGEPYGHAFSFVSALSLPYLLEQLVPQLAAAVDGNPATT
ncbi:iron-siderophore ABC transporter substrate-binding protein [Phytohabitans flavus]|uniref:ABC transporter substrate-binding protein n=1 Tax=Phytohabitans flavus TaxID=1076124 RepID=A0A6F8Y159_9ACTN|nr:iron-siderophore ABC transporter substrate-binding protein [Phytohabitans flavus]BCB79769.1 ABC transporter substrate-binding protein [Phytohabitans flavus]